MINMIFTKNAMNKLRGLNLSRQTIYDTVSNADTITQGREPEVNFYQKEWKFGQVTVIAKKIEAGKLLIISCSARYKNRDFHRKPEDTRYKNVRFLKRIFVDITKKLGL